MYRKSFQNWMKHIDFILLDILCLQIAYCIAYMIRHGSGIPYEKVMYQNVAFTLIVIDLLVAVFFESMKNILKRDYYKEFTMTVKHVCMVELLLILYLFLGKNADKYSRAIVIIMGVIYLVLTYLVRLAWKKYLIKYNISYGNRSILILTTDYLAKSVVENIKNNNYSRFLITGVAIINKDMTGCSIDDVPVVADKDSVLDYVCRRWIDEVFLNIPESEPYPSELINKFSEMGVVVHLQLLKSSNLIGKKQFVERMGNYTVLTISINTATTTQLFLKRLLDIVGGLVGCLITLLLCIVIGPMIYKKSPGPIFFAQERVGKNGKKFKMYKFRSMYLDAEERKEELMEQNRVKDGMMFKLDWDPRIIGSKLLPDGTMKKGIGNYIRDFSLDEFPQFFNVLKGDMSLVGTRPPTLDEWNKYELHHRARLAIKPGVTGMWQVSGRSNITDFEEVVHLDTEYITEWNIGLDIKILFKTLMVVLKKDGSM